MAVAASRDVRRRVLGLPDRFRPESGNGLRAEWELRIGDLEFAISVAEHRCEVREGPGSSPAAVVTSDPATWIAIDEGKLAGGDAFLDRKLQVEGNLDLAVRLQTLFQPYRRARRPMDLDQLEVSVGGVSISAYQMGSGDALILLHGLGGTKISWLPVLGPLAERFRVVVPDLPGHGESGKPNVDYSPRFYARAVRGLMDALDTGPAVVVGNSMGGRVALELAARSPSRTRAVALLAPSVPGMRWRHLMAFTKLFPARVGAIPFPLRQHWMEVAMHRLFADPARTIGPEALAVAAQEAIRIYHEPAARMAFFSSLRNVMTERPDPFWNAIRRIKQPSLVIVGDGDRVVPPRLGMKLAERLPDSTLVVLPGVGHVPQFEAPAETLEALKSLLSKA